MKKIPYFLILISLQFSIVSYAHAIDKISDSLNKHELKITPVVVQTPSIPATSPSREQTTLETTPWDTPVTPTQTLPIEQPSATQVPVKIESSIPISAGTQKIDTTPSMDKVKITVPDFEEKYRKMMDAKEEAKRKKKKSLIDSILDEIIHYGYLIVLVAVIAIVVFALRKDKKTPGTGFQLPQHDMPKLPQEPKKDIWHDEF